MSVCLCVTSSDHSSTCSLQPCSEITLSIRWHYCDSQCRSLLMHVVHIKCTYTISSQCCWEQKSYLNNTNCLIKHVKRTPHSSKHGQHQTHLSECSSRMQKKKACRIMRLYSFWIQVLPPYFWKQLLGLLAWWPHKVWGEWDNVVVCLWSSVMLIVILEQENTC